jgi:membrane protease YdiL (CAAX protease family)
MNDSEPESSTSAAELEAPRPPTGLIAPWWHTVLLVLLVAGISATGARQLHAGGGQQLRLVPNYSLSIVYEWALAGIAWWGLRLRNVPLKQLLGETRPGLRGWLADLGAALLYWVVALMLLSLVAQALLYISGSSVDPRKIGDVTQKLAPSTGPEMMLFLMLSISAGVCEEFVFRGYLQQQFGRAGRRIWVGVVLSAIVFGGAHLYEGIAGVVLIAAYGAMFGVLTILRRGLRTGMIAHAWHDSFSGAALMLLRHYSVHIGSK